MAERQYYYKGNGAPNFIPPYAQAHYLDEAANPKALYKAQGTSSIADWKRIAMADMPNEWKAQQVFNNGGIAFASPLVWDLEDKQSSSVVVTAPMTINAPLNIKPHGTYNLQITQDGTGGHAVTYDAAFKFPSNTPPADTTADKTTLISCVGDPSGTFLRCAFIEGLD